MSVKELRTERGLSQEALAEQSGLSLRTIQRIEAGNRAGTASRLALAAALGIDEPELARVLSMDKASAGWRRRPAWVRALFLGSGSVRMDGRQHLLVERCAVAGGILFLLVGVLGPEISITPESGRVPLLLGACLLFLGAWLMSVVIRIGDQHGVWPWVEVDDG